jgi:hypothetical protein
MSETSEIIEQAPLQDQDLLQRLSSYFDAFDSRLKKGQGWFIFNAPSGRSRRISSFIQTRLNDYGSRVSFYVVSWRDFALSAYVNEVGLPQLAPEAADGSNARLVREVELARRVTQDTVDHLVFSDLLVLIGLKPTQAHEAVFLDRTIDGRYRQRLATILLTPDPPEELAAEFASLDPTKTYWERLFNRMYETSLVAL